MATENRTELREDERCVRIASGHELRQERNEEQRQLRIEEVEEHATPDDPAGAHVSGRGPQVERAMAAQRRPRHPQQVGDAGEFDRLEEHGRGVQDGGEAEEREAQVQHRAEGAPD